MYNVSIVSTAESSKSLNFICKAQIATEDGKRVFYRIVRISYLAYEDTDIAKQDRIKFIEKITELYAHCEIKRGLIDYMKVCQIDREYDIRHKRFQSRTDSRISLIDYIIQELEQELNR